MGRHLEWIALRSELVLEITREHLSNGRIRHNANRAAMARRQGAHRLRAGSARLTPTRKFAASASTADDVDTSAGDRDSRSVAGNAAARAGVALKKRASAPSKILQGLRGGASRRQGRLPVRGLLWPGQIQRLPARAGRVVCFLAVCLWVLTSPVAPDARAAALPSGFQESVIFSGLTNPTAVRFASDGRIFVAEKSGRIKVYDGLSDTSPTLSPT